MITVTINGQTVDFRVAADLMDDEIREELHSSRDWQPGEEQDFADAYSAAHQLKFSEAFRAE